MHSSTARNSAAPNAPVLLPTDAASSSTPLISARELSRTFPHAGATPVLDGVSLDIHAGEFVALTGPSGSGKSTLLYCLSGLDRPSAGSVRVGDTDLATLGERELARLRRERMGFVFQTTEFLDELSVLENVLLPALPRSAARAAARDRALVLMARLGIEALAHRRPAELSGGQRQRAGICRALINEPAVLFADEPTGALHRDAVYEVIDLFTELNASGMTVLLVTHDPEVAARATSRCELVDGRMV